MEITNKVSNLHSFLTKVYGWMCASLIVSFISAVWFMHTILFQKLMLSASSKGEEFLGGIIFFAIMMLIIREIYKKSVTSPIISGTILLIFSIIMGMTMSFSFAIYTPMAILQAFIISAATFGGMSIVGACTKKDMTKFGNQLMGALIAFIIVSFIEIFFQTPLVIIVMSLIGVILFSLFTTFDTNRIVHGDFGNTDGAAIVCALELYLDFANLFIDILNLIGGFNNNN